MNENFEGAGELPFTRKRVHKHSHRPWGKQVPLQSSTVILPLHVINLMTAFLFLTELNAFALRFWKGKWYQKKGVACIVEFCFAFLLVVVYVGVYIL